MNQVEDGFRDSRSLQQRAQYFEQTQDRSYTWGIANVPYNEAVAGSTMKILPQNLWSNFICSQLFGLYSLVFEAFWAHTEKKTTMLQFKK